MTNEEAIAKLEDVAKNMLWACGEYSEALEMAIKALEQEPCIQEKQANADKIDAVYIDGFKAGYSQARFDLEQEPSDTVSRGVFEQVMWERDIAIGQLKELGYGLGQKVEPQESEE